MMRADDPRGTSVRADGTPTVVDLRSRPAGVEEQSRVLSTAADLAASGRSITTRELVRLSGLEPERVDACVDALRERGRLVPHAAGQLVLVPQPRDALSG